MHLFVILKELESIFIVSFLFTSGYIFFFSVIVAILSSTLKYSSLRPNYNNNYTNMITS